MKWYYTFKEWRHLLSDSLYTFVKGLLMLIWLVISALTSIVIYAYQKTLAFCRREFLPSMIIFFIGLLLILCWCLTFACERAHRKTAEYQRDSVSYVLSKITQAYDKSDTINDER